jgi:hypothetical protein
LHDRPGYAPCLPTILAAALVQAAAPAAAAGDPPLFRFATAFAQVGIGDQRARAGVLGASWDWNWRQQLRFGMLTGYVEAAGGRWNTGKPGAAWTTQVSATPVFRWHAPGRAARWFGEIGVGGNLILPLFRSGSKRFSTEFNFGDHFAIGRDFGDRAQHALALRLEHFSNAGINHPNPGENFLQLRYSYHLQRAGSRH